MTNKATKNILIVEDDESILEVIKIILEESGYSTTTITGGNLLKKYLKNSTPDLILLDIWISGYDGREITRYLRSKEQTKNIPIVVISAHSEARKIAQSLKVDDFIAKPFDMDELLDKVGRLVS